MGKLLGIDYGTKQVGLALSDERERLAFPYIALENDKELIDKIKQVAKEESVTTIVLGESLTYKRKDNPLMKEIRTLKEALEKTLKLPVHLEPEWLTSHEARRSAATPKLVDASAAALILQTYLDKQIHGTSNL